MEYSDDDLFPEDRPDALHVLQDLFPEEAETIKERRADEIWERIGPHVQEMISTIAEAVDKEFESIHEILENSTEEHTDSIDDLESKFDPILKKLEDIDTLHTSLGKLAKKLDSNKSELSKELETSSKRVSQVAHRALSLINELNDVFPSLKIDIKRAHTRIDNLPEEYDDRSVWEELKELRSMILKSSSRGGSIDRNIWIGGNSSVLSRYTDIDLLAGANVTLTYQNNDTTKTTDITIAATGGSGSGIVRSVNSVAVSTLAGAVAGTDYVYLAAGTINITLPTSVGNSNLYTVKNIGAGTVTILTTGGDTIDGSANLQMPVQFTSVDLISNNSGNWDIT